MSNFWNNFTNGFANGFFMNNPFNCGFGMNPFECYSPMNSIFGPFNNPFNCFPSNMYLYPNVMSSAFITPLMPETQMPIPTIPNNFSLNINRIFISPWDIPLTGGATSIPGMDIFEKTTSEATTTKKDSTTDSSSSTNIGETTSSKTTETETTETTSRAVSTTASSEPVANQTSPEPSTASTNVAKKTSKKANISQPNNKHTNTTSQDEPIETTSSASSLKARWNKINPSLSTEFYQKVINISRDINCSPNDLLALMRSESGIQPGKTNSIGATGLIQFTRTTAKDLGTSTNELRQMSAIKQLDYVRKYFLRNKKASGYSSNARLDRGTLYAICFLPKYAKQETLCTRGDKYYAKNKGLDINKDGRITKTELAKRIENKLV